MYGQFKINHERIVPKKLAILPLIVYFYELFKKGIKFRHLDDMMVTPIRQYLILSQINDWNLQTIVNNFTKIIIDNSNNETGVFLLPLSEFIDFINQSQMRPTDISEARFIGYTWFALKILTPERIYNFEPSSGGQFNPEIDHIFPYRLKGGDEYYKTTVDVLWNLQPITKEVNGFKLAEHPKVFFQSQTGVKYLQDYDFLPSKNLDDQIWDDPSQFIGKRRELMMEFFERKYGLKFI